MASNGKTATADAQFKKTQREQDGKKAMIEYEAAVVAMRSKTAKLRALRLARDAELAAVNGSVAPIKIRKAKPKAPTISDYRRDQQGSRNR